MMERDILYVKGYGMEKNYTKAKEYSEKATDKEEPGEKTRRHYNLEIMYLKRIGEKRNVKSMQKIFKVANVGHPKAFYQLAGMFYTGIGLEESSNGYRII